LKVNVKPFLDFEGKRIVVTGASSGIGRAVARELGKYGANLVLVGRRREQLENTAQGSDPASCYVMELDLSNHSDILTKIKEARSDFGRLYGLCHCAGLVETRPLSSYKLSGLNAMLDVNLLSGIELARAICRRDVVEQEGGSLVFISSIYWKVGMSGQIGYAASKGAVVSAVRSMAIELARKNIRVNSLSPGFVKTPMTENAFTKLPAAQLAMIEAAHPLGVGTPEDVAKAAAFLLAPQSSWVTGIDLTIDGGYTAQ
jgi:NAD(P)-dependent dehydrogenase (short-subunit alcohol dehydrogenase family)